MSSQYIVHTVGAGDTVQSIGELYGVDWTQVVTINGLEYPYIDDDLINNESTTIDSVAKIGSKLVIPTIGLQIPNKINNSSKEIEKYAFGCDIDLFSLEKSSNKYVNLEVAGQMTDNLQGDLLLSEGVTNLRQQLIIRLGTPKGALILHPEFGSNLLKYIGRKTTVELLTEVSLEIQECILGDFRVKEIMDIQVIFKDGGIWVSCIIQPIEPYSAFQLEHVYYSE